jgi:hypothetical protein
MPSPCLQSRMSEDYVGTLVAAVDGEWGRLAFTEFLMCGLDCLVEAVCGMAIGSYGI